MLLQKSEPPCLEKVLVVTKTFSKHGGSLCYNSSGSDIPWDHVDDTG
jgi:hypothetical protein